MFDDLLLNFYTSYIYSSSCHFLWGLCYSIFSFLCMFCRSLLYFFFCPLCCLFFFDIQILITPLVSSDLFCTFSFVHCVVFSSSIYRFWLPLRCLQTLLIAHIGWSLWTTKKFLMIGFVIFTYHLYIYL